MSSIVDPGERVAGLESAEHNADEDLAAEIERSLEARSSCGFLSPAKQWTLATTEPSLATAIDDSQIRGALIRLRPTSPPSGPQNCPLNDLETYGFLLSRGHRLRTHIAVRQTASPAHFYEPPLAPRPLVALLARVEQARIVDRRQLAQAAHASAAFGATAELHTLSGPNDEAAIDDEENEDIRLEGRAAS